MIVELAIINARPGQGDAMQAGLTAARAVIQQAAGYRASTFHRGVEQPDRFVLYITWDAVADHEEGFRKGPLFPRWRAHFAEYMAPPPDVSHYTVFAEG